MGQKNTPPLAVKALPLRLQAAGPLPRQTGPRLVAWPAQKTGVGTRCPPRFLCSVGAAAGYGRASPITIFRLAAAGKWNGSLAASATLERSSG